MITRSFDYRGHKITSESHSAKGGPLVKVFERGKSRESAPVFVTTSIEFAEAWVDAAFAGRAWLQKA